MSRKKIVTTEIVDNVMEHDTNTQDEKEKSERKIDRLFKELRGSEEGFELTLYKVKDRGKSRVEKYYNEVPDLSSIRDTFGGGKYAIYCTYSDGRYDYAEIELEGLPENKKKESREQVLQEIKAMRDILQTPQQDNSILIEIMKMNQAAIENQNKMIMEINNKFTQMQLESEKRLLEVLKTKNNNFGEIMQMIEFIDSIRGGTSAEGPSLLEKLLTAPAVQQTIAGIISNSAQAELPAPQKVKISDKFSPQFVEFVSPETTEKATELIMQKLHCDKNNAEKIVRQILKEKGAA